MDRSFTLQPHPAAERFHVVLVEPGDPLNIGSVARAMSNLGFHRLHLVAPPRYDRARAATTACWAEHLLDSAAWHETLAEALAGMHEVAGFAVRGGRHRPRHLLLPDWVAEQRTAPARHTALVFGPEDNGLRAEHVELCHTLVRIPSTAANPAFNLAQSVLLALGEISRHAWDAVPRGGSEAPASGADHAQLDRLVDEALQASGFYGVGTPRHVPAVVKQLTRRMRPSAHEMQVLLGLFSRINRALAGRVPVQPYAGAPYEAAPSGADEAAPDTGADGSAERATGRSPPREPEG